MFREKLIPEILIGIPFELVLHSQNQSFVFRELRVNPQVPVMAQHPPQMMGVNQAVVHAPLMQHQGFFHHQHQVNNGQLPAFPQAQPLLHRSGRLLARGANGLAWFSFGLARYLEDPENDNNDGAVARLDNHRNAVLFSMLGTVSSVLASSINGVLDRREQQPVQPPAMQDEEDLENMVWANRHLRPFR